MLLLEKSHEQQRVRAMTPIYISDERMIPPGTTGRILRVHNREFCYIEWDLYDGKARRAGTTLKCTANAKEIEPINLR